MSVCHSRLGRQLRRVVHDGILATAARADFLTRLGRLDEARVAFEEALILTDNDGERSYLQTRLSELTG